MTIKRVMGPQEWGLLLLLAVLAFILLGLAVVDGRALKAVARLWRRSPAAP